MRNKQYLAAIRPLDGSLAMSTLRFADDIVAKSDIDGIPRKAKVEAKELKLANQIIDSLSGEWEAQQYRDTYTEELRKRIDARRRARTSDEVEEPENEATSPT